MTRSRYKLIAVFVMLVMGVMTSRGESSSTPNLERRSLKGLPGVIVQTFDLYEEASKEGITEATTKTDVEVRLRKAGIKVFTSEDDHKWISSGRPTILIRMSNTVAGSWRAIRTDIWLLQDARLTRNADGLPVTTWDHGATMTGSGTLRQEIRNLLGDLVDSFINDYLAVNPK
jgi:hypothetical protein